MTATEILRSVFFRFSPDVKMESPKKSESKVDLRTDLTDESIVQNAHTSSNVTFKTKSVYVENSSL